MKNILENENIEFFGILSLNDCKIINQGLFDRKTPFAESVVLFLIPYYTIDECDKNVSLYAISRDYHIFIREITERIIARLKSIYPGNRFAGMGDHSPIDEVNAAAACGLGIIGDNRCLINKKYGSYVFIGEIFTDLKLPSEAKRIELCSHCGLCQKACPSPDECLSELTQRKGELEDSTLSLMCKSNTAWGCDICQEVCPHNKDISPTPIDFFYQDRIPHLTPEIIENMSDDELSSRAYGWRKRQTIYRNIKAITDNNRIMGDIN